MGIPKRRNSFASNRYAQQLRRRMSGRKISITESWSRFHFAERTVQRGWSCKLQRLSGPHRFAKGYLNPPLTPPRQSKPFRGSRLNPSKADSRWDQKGKHLATCTVETDSPCIPQGKRVPDAGSRDHKTTDPYDHWCDLKSASTPC
jgi:hypothetical protein